MIWQERPYQQEAISACLEAFGAGRVSVMLKSPVGSGKTFMGLEIVRRLGEKMGRPLRIAWVAPRRHLLEQVMEANRDLHMLQVRPVSLFEKTPPTADIVVLDEAHHEATQSCVLLYEKIKAPLTLGLSATPLRTDRMKLSFQDTIMTCGIDRLIREQYLSPFHSYLLPHWGPRIAAECYLNDPKRWGKSLAFFSTVAECCQYRDELAKQGVRCEVVTGESDKDLQLAKFLSGEVQVIANVSMLTEGFDQPDVQSVFARDASRVPTIQMCGRGLRLAEGKDHCNIVQSSATPYLFEKVTPCQRAFRLHNGQWLALQDKTKEIEETLKRSLELLEAREQAKKTRRERMRSHTIHGDEQSTRDDGRTVGIDPTILENYKFFYALYEFCNRLGWNGALPPCKLSFNCSEKPSNVAGFASPERPYPRLCLNLSHVARWQTASGIPILFHEMVHIWQFANGRRGGHGRDFRNELYRVGVDESHGRINPGSAVARAMEMVQQKYPGMAARWFAMVGKAPKNQRKIEQQIFNEYLMARNNRV